MALESNGNATGDIFWDDGETIGNSIIESLSETIGNSIFESFPTLSLFVCFLIIRIYWFVPVHMLELFSHDDLQPSTAHVLRTVNLLLQNCSRANSHVVQSQFSGSRYW